ncbi:MAG: glycoside hydrolase family 3 C-terminal domain-containing protein, partial [Lachnospiraceae bacterium]|nr:glycoside hydrolase family 3 C-terminal domain-containing protein [Lachnospiraceae bacterium]
MERWARAKYQPNLPLREGQHVTASKEHITLSKEAAKEGMVLLKNDKNLLPLRAGSRAALFGKGSFDYVKGGGGSGDVIVSYVRNLYDGLKLQEDTVTLYEPLSDFYRNDVKEQYAEGAAPGMTVEPSLPDELVEGAKAFADTAIITISRFSGEGWDRSSVEYDGEYNPWETETSMPKIAGEIFEDGDFYLTKKEKEMIQKVKENFAKVAVVLNIGGTIDTTWIKEDDAISSALVAWQAGMAGGLAAAELLCGKASPSGKLPDTFARRLEDYPSTENFHESPHYVDYTEDIYVGYRYFETIPGADSKVCYPFGFGLSYTQFEIVPHKTLMEDGVIRITVQVTNVGRTEGKEVVQAYYSVPQGILQKPYRELAAFAKTRSLLPGESQTVVLEFARNEMASYDDLGKIAESAYVLEKGTYEFY